MLSKVDVQDSDGVPRVMLDECDLESDSVAVRLRESPIAVMDLDRLCSTENDPAVSETVVVRDAVGRSRDLLAVAECSAELLAVLDCVCDGDRMSDGVPVSDLLRVRNDDGVGPESDMVNDWLRRLVGELVAEASSKESERLPELVTDGSAVSLAAENDALGDAVRDLVLVGGTIFVSDVE